MSESRIRALVIAESCNPEWESIPLAGWSHANALREVADVHIVTRLLNRDAMLRAGLVEGQDFTALDNEFFAQGMYRLVQKILGPNKGWAMLTALQIPSYYLFEILLWRRHGKALRAGQFDVVHRVTPLSPATPSLLAWLCRRAGVPFIVGPLNGGLPWPPGFPNLRRKEGEFLSRLRELYRLVPFYRSTRRDAAAIIVGGASALADLAPRWRSKAIYIPENGIELARFPQPVPPSADSFIGRPLRAVFLGRLVPYKGADMLIEATAPLLTDGRMSLEIIGFGPERPALEAQTASLGLTEKIVFSGKISHHDVAAHMRQADVFAFPSVREFGGAVVLEAMAMGVVPLVVDYGGPGELVNAKCGITIPLGDRAEVVASLRRALERLVAHPEQLAPLAEHAVTRARSLFAWPVKARQSLEVYRWVLGRRADKPDFGLPLTDLEANDAAGRVEQAAALA